MKSINTDRFEPLDGAVLLGVSEGESTYYDASNDHSHHARAHVLLFDRGTLVIENPIILAGAATLGDLVNKTLIDPLLTLCELRLVFGPRQELSVSLRPEHFNSPEAAVYTPNDGTSITVFQ